MPASSCTLFQLRRQDEGFFLQKDERQPVYEFQDCTQAIYNVQDQTGLIISLGLEKTGTIAFQRNELNQLQMKGKRIREARIAQGRCGEIRISHTYKDL